MKVVWSRKAEAALIEILDYIAQDSIENGLRFIAKLRKRAEGLSSFPNSGRKIPEFPNNDLREVIEGNYRIFYRVKNKTVEIVTVFESHRLVAEEKEER